MAEIGRHRRHHRPALPGLAVQPCQRALHVVGQGTVANHYAFGLPRGAGSEDHIGRTGRVDDHGRRLRCKVRRPSGLDQDCLIREERRGFTLAHQHAAHPTLGQ